MQTEDDFVDLLRGAQAIADYSHESYRQSTKQIPGWKVGAIGYSTKPKIRARLLGEVSDTGGA